MRKFLSNLLFILLLAPVFSFAQVNDSASIGAGYTNQTFYSLSKGTISSISNTNWDLGFHADKREVSIIINSKNDVKLWLATSDTTKWSTIDTAGKISVAQQLHNSDSNWINGAFNRVPNGTFDYGWGTYDQNSHAVIANNIYFISYMNGANRVWKKIIISKHSVDYVYYFRYANLDGTNEKSTAIVKNNYKNRNFIYYSLVNDSILDREPDRGTYDLIMCQYEQEIPVYYKVSGVLLNTGVKAKMAYPVANKSTVDYKNYTLVKNISEIGAAWKTFNFTTNGYDMKDSTVYFVQDVTGKIWKLIFTGFGGGANGTMYFTKTQVGTNGVNAPETQVLGMYPNPSQTLSVLNYYSRTQGAATLRIADLNGKTISAAALTMENGFNQYEMDTRNLANGTYIVQLVSTSGIVSQKLIVNR